LAGVTKNSEPEMDGPRFFNSQKTLDLNYDEKNHRAKKCQTWITTYLYQPVCEHIFNRPCADESTSRSSSDDVFRLQKASHVNTNQASPGRVSRRPVLMKFTCFQPMILPRLQIWISHDLGADTEA